MMTDRVPKKRTNCCMELRTGLHAISSTFRPEMHTKDLESACEGFRNSLRDLNSVLVSDQHGEQNTVCISS
jgi:hypothetical protein